MSAAQHNWATNIRFQTTDYHEPESLSELQAIVGGAARVKVVGSRHCFNDIADTAGALISLERMDKSVTFDHARQTATVNAGIRYNELCPILHEAGYALPNLASLPHVTVIGACATATHGSGDRNGTLSTAVSGLEMVMANGEVRTFTRRDEERFDGMVVALGALGAVTKVTLDLVPAFTMQQDVYEALPVDALEAHFDAIMAGGYSVSLFADWRGETVNQLWCKQRLPDGQPQPAAATLHNARLATEEHHPLDGVDPAPCTQQRGVAGPWYERLPHFHIRSTLVGGDELQSEYFVAREQGMDALRAVRALQPYAHEFFKVTEVRSMAADRLWLSMAYGRDTIGIHFSWHNRWPQVARFLPRVEEALAPFRARPHWGKLFTMAPAQVQALYPRLDDFRALRQELDPGAKFLNSYLEKYIGPVG